MTPTSVEFHVLLALMEGPRHGYGVMQDVAAMTDERVKLGPGTLYSIIKRFLRDGLVEECAADAERRRCYRLTRKGVRATADEAERLAALVRLHRQKQRLAT